MNESETRQTTLVLSSIVLVTALLTSSCAHSTPSPTPGPTTSPTATHTAMPSQSPSTTATPAPTHTPRATLAPSATRSATPDQQSTPSAQEGSGELLGEQVHLTFWHSEPPESDRSVLLDTLIDEFEAAYPEIEVEAVYQGDEDRLYSQLLAAWSKKAPPDLVVLHPYLVADLAQLGAVADLEPYLDDATLGLSATDQRDLIPTMLEVCRFPSLDDRLLAFPYDLGAQGLWYNLDLLKAAGYSAPPSTWDELEAMSRAIASQQGRKACVLPADALVFDAWLASRGVRRLNSAQTATTLDGPEAHQALALVVRLLDAGALSITTEAEAARKELAEGRAAFVFGPTNDLPWYRQAIAASGAVGEWGQAVVPQQDTSRPATVLDGTVFAVLRSAVIRQKAAWLFIRYFASASVTARWSAGTGSLPVRASAGELLSDYYAREPIAREQFERILPYSQASPNLAGEQELRSLIGDALVSVGAGKATPQQALGQAAAQAHELLMLLKH